MILVSPASYIGATAFKGMANDYDLTSYTDAQISDILVRASGAADSIMKRSLLAQERTLEVYGTGDLTLDLGVRPLIYVRKAQFLQPGTAGYSIPIENLVVDYERGQLVIYTPLVLQGIGIVSLFPEDFPIAITVGTGYGFTVSPPSVILADASGGTLSPGQYDVAVTARTPWGETTATAATVASSLGAIALTIKPQLGASSYRIFAAPHGVTPLTLMSEVPATTYGVATIAAIISSLTPPADQFPEQLPIADTSANPTPPAIIEAVRLLALQSLYEQNNLANRGVAQTVSGLKRLQWRSTEGSSGRGQSYTAEQATALLKPYMFSGIF